MSEEYPQKRIFVMEIYSDAGGIEDFTQTIEQIGNSWYEIKKFELWEAMEAIGLVPYK